MNLELFTSFEGRINRQKFWIGVIAIVVATVVLSMLLGMILGDGGGFAVASLILYLLLLYPALAVGIKRLHDRDKAAVPWAIIFYGPGILLQIMQVLGIGFTDQTVQGMTIAMPTALGGIVSGIAVIVGIWALIEMGFLRGTRGPNQFGPDPLEQ